MSVPSAFIALVLAAILLVPAYAMQMIGFGTAPSGIVHGNDNTLVGSPYDGYQNMNHNLSFASGTNRVVVVGVSEEDSALQTYTCTYDGASMTQAATSANPSTVYQNTSLFYILDADLPSSTGTYQVRCDPANWSTQLHMYALEFKGVDQAVPEDNTAYSSQSSQTTTVTLDASSGALVIDIAASSTNTDTWTHGSGQTNLSVTNDTEQITAVGWKITTGAGSTSVTHQSSGTGRRQAASGASFAPAP